MSHPAPEAANAPAQHATFVLERAYPHAPARVFTLLSTLAGKKRWYLEGPGVRLDSYDLDFRVGGAERARYSYQAGTPVDGLPFINDGVFLDIVPERRIVQASSMNIVGRFVSATLATWELEANGSGTTLRFTHQGVFVEGSGGADLREHGWVSLFDRLATALEAGTAS